MAAAISFDDTDDKNLETFCLIWLDSNISEDRGTEQKLRSIINHSKKFQDVQQCRQYIKQTSENDRLVLIVNGQLGREIVPSIHELRQIISIYVYCMDQKVNQLWSSEFAKVKDVITNLDELIVRIAQDHNIQKKIEEPFSMNIYSTNTGGTSTTALNGQFVFLQVLIDCLLRLESNQNDKDELIKLCEHEYQGNRSELDNLKKFQNEYSSQKALHWYTKESFFYRILNTALRTQNIHMLFLLRSFISDIQRQLQKYPSNEVLQVYRAQIMSEEELNHLKQSTDQFISINSFFSTSKDFDSTIFRLGEKSPLVNWERVLFEINANPKMVTAKPFADLSQYSDFPNESEVLFMTGSIFRLEKIDCNKNQIWIIKMTLCKDDDHDLKQVLRYMHQQTGNGATNLRILGKVLWEMGKLDLAEKYIKRLMNGLSSTDSLLCDLCEDLGKLASQAGNYGMSMQWHQKSLSLKEQNLLSSGSNQVMIRCGSPYGNFEGGGSFDDASDLKLPTLTYCIGIEAFWKPYLFAIRFIYDWNDTSYRKVYHGNEDNPVNENRSLSSEKFLLSKTERINKVTLYVGTGTKDYTITVGGEMIRYVMGIQFHTTNGRTTRLYGIRGDEKFTESFEGFTLGYVKGRSGLVIDSLQFVWYSEARFAKTYDDIWVEAEDGLIPSDAVIVGQEDDKRVYIVRFQSKEGNYIIGKLVEGNKSAEASYFDVQISSCYQVLTNSNQKQKFRWMIANIKSIPENAFLAGKEQGYNIYIGRLFYSSGSILIGKSNTSQATLFFTQGKYKITSKDHFEVLCVC